MSTTNSPAGAWAVPAPRSSTVRTRRAVGPPRVAHTHWDREWYAPPVVPPTAGHHGRPGPRPPRRRPRSRHSSSTGRRSSSRTTCRLARIGRPRRGLRSPPVGWRSGRGTSSPTRCSRLAKRTSATCSKARWATASVAVHGSRTRRTRSDTPPGSPRCSEGSISRPSSTGVVTVPSATCCRHGGGGGRQVANGDPGLAPRGQLPGRSDAQKPRTRTGPPRGCTT